LLFFQEFLKTSAQPLGEIVDFGIRIEFQARGSPHAHCVIWVEDAPKFGVSEDSGVCSVIEKYIFCAILKEEKTNYALALEHSVLNNQEN